MMEETEINFSYKNFFKNYGLFLAIIIVIMALLIYSVIFARTPWQKYLKAKVETVLNEYDENNWVVGDFVQIDNPFCLNSACYQARYKKTGENYNVIILRIQTFYGPVSGVFTIDKNNTVNFVGYSSLHGRVATQLNNSKADKRLDYWKKKIPDIIQKGDSRKNEE